MNDVGGDSTVAVIIAVAGYLAMRLIDRMLPGGHHFKIVDRWMTQDKTDEEDTDEP